MKLQSIDRALGTKAFIALCTLMALGVRLYGLDREFWLNEYTTAGVVKDGFAPIFESAWINDNTPAYFLVVRCSIELFGYNEPAMRLASIVSGVLLVPAVYIVARKMSVTRPLAMAGCLLTAIDPSCIEFLWEVWPSALVQLVTAIQVYALEVYAEAILREGGFSLVTVQAVDVGQYRHRLTELFTRQFSTKDNAVIEIDRLEPRVLSVRVSFPTNPAE